MSLLSNFPTELLILHKASGKTYEVSALVSNSNVMSEKVDVPIEINDYFERVLPSGVKEYYKVLDPGFHKKMGGINDHYQTKVELLKNPPVIENPISSKKLIFISHSQKDKEYTRAFVDFLFNIGLNEEDIVCSSYPGLGIPLRSSIYTWLLERFQKYNLHVIYFLSHNYYHSAASLNEMGAAWAMKQKWDGILLPGFDYSDVCGCIDALQISIKLDGDIDELKHHLFELKSDIIEEFELREISVTRWEKIRDEYIDTVNSIKRKETGKKHEDDGDEKQIFANQPAFSVAIEAINKQLPGTAEVLDSDFSPKTKHTNVQLSIEVINDKYARNIIIFDEYLYSALKPSEKKLFSIAYEDSEDVRKWPGQVIKILHSDYDDVKGLPKWFNICYQDEFGHNMIQSMKLGTYDKAMYYMPDGIPWEV